MLRPFRKMTWRDRIELICEMILTLVTGALAGYWWCHARGGNVCWPF